MLDCHEIAIGNAFVTRSHHRIDEIHTLRLAIQGDLAGLHRTTRNEDRRDVESHSGVEHSWGDLVAVGNTHHGIGAVGIHHVLDAIGDDLAGWERVEHAIVTHGDAVIDRDGVELLGDAARFLDLACHQLAEIFEVNVTRHELRERVHHGNDWLAEITIFHAGGAPKSTGACHIASVSSCSRSILWHVRQLLSCGYETKLTREVAPLPRSGFSVHYGIAESA